MNFCVAVTLNWCEVYGSYWFVSKKWFNSTLRAQRESIPNDTTPVTVDCGITAFSFYCLRRRVNYERIIWPCLIHPLPSKPNSKYNREISRCPRVKKRFLVFPPCIGYSCHIRAVAPATYLEILEEIQGRGSNVNIPYLASRPQSLRFEEVPLYLFL